MSLAEPTTEGTYGDRVVAVEPGGNEHIAEADRHGRPSQLFWTWTSPNLEFATIFVGMLAVLAFGMTFWQAVAGIMVGTGLGAVAHEEADNVIVQQVMLSARNNEESDITVISDDTDVFILLLHYYHAENLKNRITMESPIKERTVIDIGKL